MTRLPARRNPAAVRSKEEERTNTLTSQDQTLGSRQLPPLSGGLASGKAYVSTFPTPPTPYSDHDNQPKEQCDHASKQSAMSPSMNQVVPVHVEAISSSAVWQPRPVRNPCDLGENCGS